jgi:hypothetical protein
MIFFTAAKFTQQISQSPFKIILNSYIMFASLQHTAKGPTAPSRRHSQSCRRHRLCRRLPSAQDRRATRASGEASWPSAQTQPSAQPKRRRQGLAVGTNGRRHRRMRAPPGLTDGGSYADGTAQFNFSREKIPAGLFLLVRAQILGPTCADGIAAHARAVPSAQEAPSLFFLVLLINCT